MKQSLRYIIRLGFLLLLALPFSALAQQASQITGSVRSSRGEALIGASVRLVGTTQGTLTDSVGKFSLTARIGDTLLVTSVGMQAKKVKIHSARLTIILEEDNKLIEDVVVTGYQKIRNRVYTGAASSVKMKDIHLKGRRTSLVCSKGVSQAYPSRAFLVHSVLHLVSISEVGHLY